MTAMWLSLPRFLSSLLGRHFCLAYIYISVLVELYLSFFMDSNNQVELLKFVSSCILTCTMHRGWFVRVHKMIKCLCAVDFLIYCRNDKCTSWVLIKWRWTPECLSYQALISGFVHIWNYCRWGKCCLQFYQNLNWSCQTIQLNLYLTRWVVLLFY